MPATCPQPVGTPHTTPARTAALAVGPWDVAEMRAARSCIHDADRWEHCPTIDEATEGAAELADAVLLATPRPGFFRQVEVDALARSAPLSQVVVVAGSWCEGELRTGSPPPGLHRLYWHQLPAWWRRSTERIAQGRPPLWSYPPTLAPEDDAPPVLHGTVLVAAADHAVFATLADVLRHSGAQAEWLQTHRPHQASTPPGSGIADAGQLDAADLRRVRALRDALGLDAPLTLLLDFPRAEHLPAAAEAGATAVLGKPYLLADLARSFSLATVL